MTWTRSNLTRLLTPTPATPIPIPIPDPRSPIPDHLGSIARIVADGESWSLGVTMCSHAGGLAIGTDGDLGEVADDGGRHSGRVYGVSPPYAPWAPASEAASFRLGGDSTYSMFGHSCAWSDEGLVVGAPFRNGWGAVYWFPPTQSEDVGVSAAEMSVVGYHDVDDGYFGHGVALLDANADGAADLVVGQPNVDPAGGLPGQVRFYAFTPATSPIDSTWAVLHGVSTSDRAGTRLATGGDLDGDGSGDLLVGAIADQRSGTYSGAVWLVEAPVPSGESMLSDASAVLLGESAADTVGWSVTFAGDTNEDGYDDLLVGGPGAQPNGTGSGRAYLVFGPSVGTRSLAEADAHLDGEGELDGLGFAVARLDDVDGDGVPDFAVGAPGDIRGANEPGRVYVVSGAGALGAIDPASARLLRGREDNDFFGMAITSMGDVNADGLTDFAVAAPYDDEAGPGGGKVYILPGASW